MSGWSKTYISGVMRPSRLPRNHTNPENAVRLGLCDPATIAVRAWDHRIGGPCRRKDHARRRDTAVVDRTARSTVGTALRA